MIRNQIEFKQINQFAYFRIMIRNYIDNFFYQFKASLLGLEPSPLSVVKWAFNTRVSRTVPCPQIHFFGCGSHPWVSRFFTGVLINYKISHPFYRLIFNIFVDFQFIFIYLFKYSCDIVNNAYFNGIPLIKNLLIMLVRKNSYFKFRFLIILLKFASFSYLACMKIFD